jgi:carbon-monoxide dehydrogenase small subunit
VRVPITLTVNSVERRAEVEPRTLLVQYLRNELALTGAHIGCETSQCGACTVLMDGQAVKSCTILAVQADGSSVTTIEGLAPVGTLHPVQQAFWNEHGLQCGFCTPGMVLSTVALLVDDPARVRRKHLPLHWLPQHRALGTDGREVPGCRSNAGTTIESRPGASEVEP